MTPMNRTIRPLVLSLVAGAVCALGVGLPAAASADGGAPTPRAAELYRRATRLYADKKLAEAEPLYREAWELQQSYEIASNLGALELDLGKPRLAAEHLARALREFPLRGRAEERAALEARLSESRKLIGTLHVKVSMPGADVLVDGRFVGRSPLQADVYVEPGARLVEATLAGYGDATLPFSVEKGVTYTVALPLQPPRRRSLTPALVGGAFGAAALGTGALLVGLAEKQRSDAQGLHATIASEGQTCAATSTSCTALHAATAKADALGNTGIAFFAVAGAAAAGTAAYLLWPSLRPGGGRAPDVRASLGIGPSGGAVVITGSF
jgi:tetratricopeptide (TPR) repeat protein